MTGFSSAIISQPIFTHSKEKKVPQMSPAHAGQRLFYLFAYPCCLPLLWAAQFAWHPFLLWAQVYTSTYIHQSPWPLPELLCHLRRCPWHFLSPAGLGSLFSFIAFGTTKKRKLSWPPQSEKMGDLWGIAFLICPLCFGVPSLQDICGRAGVSNVVVFPQILDGDPLTTSVRLGTSESDTDKQSSPGDLELYSF